MSNYQSNQIKLINTSLIDPHPDNPRKNIGDVTDLAASIKTNGLLTPLSVVPNGSRYASSPDTAASPHANRPEPEPSHASCSNSTRCSSSRP